MKNMLPRKCKECGITFMGGPRAWYCPECRAERRKKADAEFKARKRLGKTRQIGEEYVCIDCGAKYILRNGLQERCPECAKKHLKEIDNQQSKKWKKENKDKYLEAKRNFDKRRRQEDGKNTGEKYISYDKANKKYRLVIKGKHIGYYNKLDDAVKTRDILLKKDVDTEKPYKE